MKIEADVLQVLQVLDADTKEISHVLVVEILGVTVNVACTEAQSDQLTMRIARMPAQPAQTPPVALPVAGPSSSPPPFLQSAYQPQGAPPEEDYALEEPAPEPAPKRRALRPVRRAVEPMQDDDGIAQG